MLEGYGGFGRALEIVGGPSFIKAVSIVDAPCDAMGSEMFWGDVGVWTRICPCQRLAEIGNPENRCSTLPYRI